MQEHNKWLKISQEDLNAAKVLQRNKFFGAVVYHCQQAAEKALKGYLAFKQQEILKTHDLVKLLDLCVLFDKEFHKKKDAVKYINPFSTKFRYPIEYDVPSCDEAKLAVKNANSIVRLVLKKISELDSGQKTIF